MIKLKSKQRLVQNVSWPERLPGLIRTFIAACFVINLSLAPVYAVPPPLDGWGHIVASPRVPAPELVCQLPLRWVQEEVNYSFPLNGFLVTEDRVYSSSYGVHAQDRQTGERLWDFTFKPTNPKNDWQAGAGITVLKEDGDKLYFGGFSGILFALNKLTGEEIWRHELVRGIENGLEFDDENIYVSTVNHLYAVNKHTGALSWRKQPTPYADRSDGFREPLLKDGRLFVQSFNILFAFDAKTGDELWRYKPAREAFPGFAHAIFPKLYQDMILVTEEENYLLTAIDMKTGKVRWQMKTSPVRVKTAAITTPEGELLISDEHGMALFDTEAKEAHWWFGTRLGMTQYRGPALYKDLVLWGSDSGYLFALDRFTGQEVFRFPYGELTRGIYALDARDDVVYLLGFDNGVYAFDLNCPQLQGRPAWADKPQGK